ncbi:MAG: hypothetical protein N2316_01245 [Spirochaetes bacterium]|nr:hypothetical protein [Spirochaetota bacterium]
MRTLKCENCAGNDFEKISQTEYRCRYCGSTHIIEPDISPTYKKQFSTNMPQKRFFLVLILLIVIVGLLLVVFWRSRMSTTNRTPILKIKPSPPSQFDAENISIASPPTASFDQIVAIPDSIGNCYFAGIYKNTGKSPIRYPMVVITLYSGDGKKIAQNRGYSIREILYPGEETPISVLITHVPKWERVEATFQPELPYYYTAHERPLMKFQNCTIHKLRFTGYEIRGEIVNKSEKPAKRIRMIAAVFDREKKIIGIGRNYVPATSIAPNDYSPIAIRIIPITGVPHSFMLDYEGDF